MQLNEDPLRHFHTDLSVGDILRRARLKKGIAVEDLEMAIRVSASHIRAIEEGRLEVLPGRIYAMGFIRAYAEYVDLDSDKILSLLKRQSGEKIAPKDITPAQSAILEDHSLPTGKMFMLLFALMVSTLGVKEFYADNKYTMTEDVPEVPKDLLSQTTLLTKPEPQATLPNAQNTAEQDPAAALQQSIPTNQIVLRAVENVWMEIRTPNKKTLFSRVLAAGEEYWIPSGQTGLSMTLGNAGGLQIIVDGHALPFLGRTGQVIRNVDLGHEKLKQILKNSPKPAM